MDIEQARRQLEEMLAELDKSLATLTTQRPESEGHGTPGDADAGLDLADHARASALLQIAQEQRREVLEALQRIENGTYGVCVSCGKPLPEGRLEAKPEAARCLSCQAKVEGR